jgi:hypothetical protein
MDKYYHGPPETKTPEQCWGHGADHHAYGWAPGVDPRWNAEQKAAYLIGFNGGPFNKKED